MSAPFSASLALAYTDARNLLTNQTQFRVPARPQGQSDFAYNQTLESILLDRRDVETDVHESISQLSTNHDRWMALRTNMTGAERTLDNHAYDDFVANTPYHNCLQELRQFARALRNDKRKLESGLSKPQPSTNSVPNANNQLIHLPKTELPKFSGDCTAFQSFWNTFKAGVHDLSISDSIKFTYLKQCLTGSPLTLISPLPVSDASYPTALDLLRKSYDNTEDVARSLHNSLRKLPRVRGGDNFCPDLRSLTEQLECICVQMDQQGQAFNPTSFQMEIEERLPRFVLDELFKLKEEDDDWTPDKLKDYLRSLLRRREQIESVTKTHTPAKPKFSSPNQHLVQIKLVFPLSLLKFVPIFPNQILPHLLLLHFIL